MAESKTPTQHRDGPNQPQLQRFVHYRELLLRAPQNLCRLIEGMDISVKTAHRDLNFLRHDWSWQIRYEPRSRQWRAHGSMPMPSLHLTAEEALALLVAEPALRAYGSTPFAPALRSALQKIIRSLDAPVELPEPAIEFQLQTVRQIDLHLFQRLAHAARGHERLELTYYNPEKQETVSRLIDPISLVNNDGAWYVNAYCHLRKDYRDFAVSTLRMKVLRNTGVFFTPAPKPEPAAAPPFGAFKGGDACEVSLRFAPSQAIYQTERAERPGEVRELQPDGSLLIHFLAPYSAGIKRWVLQYGSEVEVLGPEELREWVKDEHRKAGK